MVKKLQTIMDRVLIRLEEKEHRTEGGIVLTDETDMPRTIGIVECVGPEVRSVKKGDKVYFHEFDDLPSLEKDVVVVRERSLLGIIKE